MKRQHVAFTLPLSKADAQLIDGWMKHGYLSIAIPRVAIKLSHMIYYTTPLI